MKEYSLREVYKITRYVNYFEEKTDKWEKSGRVKIFINFFEKILGSVSKKSESRVGARPKRWLVLFQKSFVLPFPFFKKGGGKNGR